MIKESLVLFGGTGRLGKELLQQFPNYQAPTSQEIDITNPQTVIEYLQKIQPKTVIHAAAVVGLKESERDRVHTYMVNVEGTRAVAKACQQTSTRLIYISSVSVFDGQKGLYKEDDIPNPAYYYGWTKLLGEKPVEMLDDYAIVRTDFFVPGSFKYEYAFVDHYCSKLPVFQLAGLLDQIARSDYIGRIHVGCKRDSLFNILQPFLPGIKSITIAESEMPDFPRDLSLNTSLHQKIFYNKP